MLVGANGAGKSTLVNSPPLPVDDCEAVQAAGFEKREMINDRCGDS